MQNEILTERTDLMEPNVYINMLFEIEGNPSTMQLIDAIQYAFCQNEATMSRVVIGEDGRAWYEKMEKSGCKIFERNEDYKSIIKEQEKVTFQIQNGELLRVFIIQLEDRVQILLMAHHLVGDGKSLTYFIEEVMLRLSGQKVEYRKLCILDKQSFPEHTEIPKITEIYAHSMNRKWRKSGTVFGWKEYDQIHEQYWSNKKSIILEERFTPKEMKQLHRLSKKCGISMTSLIAAAFLQCSQESLHRCKDCVGIPVDIRQENNRCMSNLVSGIAVNWRHKANCSLLQNAMKFHQKMKEQLKKKTKRYFVLRFLSLLNGSLMDSVFLTTYGCYENPVGVSLAKMMGYQGKKKKTIGITNLGRIDIASEYGEYRLKSCVFLPPAVTYSERIIGVATLNDEMVITCHLMSHCEYEKNINFFQTAVQKLHRLDTVI